jgi:Flp pilus assembly protein TadB
VSDDSDDASDAAGPNDDALLTALTTEQFVLQSAASATISESSSRINAVLGGSMVALLLDSVFGVTSWAALVVAAVVAITLAFVVARYERQRFGAEFPKEQTG